MTPGATKEDTPMIRLAPLSRPAKASPATTPLEPFLSAKQVANLLGIARRTIWRYVATGLLPEPIRLNARVVRWRRTDLESALARMQATK